jgi:hypothetical protein
VSFAQLQLKGSSSSSAGTSFKAGAADRLIHEFLKVSGVRVRPELSQNRTTVGVLGGQFVEITVLRVDRQML